MDTLDKISVLIIIVLIAAISVLGMDYEGAAGNSVKYTAGRSVSAAGISEISSEMIKSIKDLIANNNIKKAEAALAELSANYPYEGEPHMMMGDVFMRKQDPVSAMFSYREAVDLNPDYVDKKTPLFQGRKIKNTLDEAKVIITGTLSVTPDDKEMTGARKTMYYLLRRLAGSCG